MELGSLNTVHPLGSPHPSDRGSAAKIRCVATGVFLFRHLFALLGGERLPTMARARPRLFRCSRTHSCPRRALDASCSTASCYRRRDRQDITRAQNLACSLTGVSDATPPWLAGLWRSIFGDAPRQQEQQPAGFHGGLPTSFHAAMPC